MIEVGENVHMIAHRRFEGDLRRHFAGEVMVSEGGVARVEGYFYGYDPIHSQFVRKPGKRTSVFQVAESGWVVNRIPKNVTIDALVYR